MKHNKIRTANELLRKSNAAPSVAPSAPNTTQDDTEIPRMRYTPFVEKTNSPLRPTNIATDESGVLVPREVE